MSKLACLALVGAASVLAAPAHGAFITEYFNGYGTATVNLAGLNGGNGWSAAWAGDAMPKFGSLSDNAAYNLNYNAPGYSNFGNGTGTSDGAAVMGGGNAGNATSRSFRTGGTDTGLTGTIWISALMDSGTSPSSHMLVWIDRPDVANSFVAIRNLSARLRYNTVDVFGPASAYATSTTYLMLARVVINASGSNDTLDMWINPNLTGGESGLGTPTLSGANNADAYGNALSGIGVSFEGFGKIDAIRISNEPTAFHDVTLVPEPTLLATASIALGALTLRRRRA